MSLRTPPDWLPVGSPLRVRAEISSVIAHSSWFVAPAVGATYRAVGVEIAARRHAIEFDEITRDYASGATRELSRVTRTEHPWGMIARVMLLTR